MHEQIFQSPFSTVSFIDRFIVDLEIQKTPSAPRQGRTVAVQRWIAPPTGVTKINVDAALSENAKLAALSAVARDASGVFVGASALVLRGADDPEMLEAAACREGLALAMDICARHVKLAGDCANVIRSINAGDVLRSYG